MATDLNRAIGTALGSVPDGDRNATSTEMRRHVAHPSTSSRLEQTAVAVSLKTCADEPADAFAATQRFTQGPPLVVLVKPEHDRTVKRKLRGIHLFVSATPASSIQCHQSFNIMRDDCHKRDNWHGSLLEKQPRSPNQRPSCCSLLIHPCRTPRMVGHAVYDRASLPLACTGRPIRLRRHLRRPRAWNCCRHYLLVGFLVFRKLQEYRN